MRAQLTEFLQVMAATVSVLLAFAGGITGLTAYVSWAEGTEGPEPVRRTTISEPEPEPAAGLDRCVVVDEPDGSTYRHCPEVTEYIPDEVEQNDPIYRR